MATSSNSHILIGGSLIAGAAVGYFYAAGSQPDIALAIGVGGIAALLASAVSAMQGVAGKLDSSLEGRERETTELAREFSESLNNVMKQTREQLGQVQESLAATVKTLDSGLSGNRQALESSVAELGKRLSLSSSEWGKELGELFAKQAGSQDAATAAMQKAVSEWQQAVGTTLGDHAQRLEAVSSSLSGQSEAGGENLRKSMEAASAGLKESFEGSAKELSIAMNSAAKDLGEKVEAVSKLAANVDSILQVSKATDQALNSLTAAGDFKDTLAAFRDHLAESERVLKEASKPKQFQLMESFGEELLEDEG